MRPGGNRSVDSDAGSPRCGKRLPGKLLAFWQMIDKRVVIIDTSNEIAGDGVFLTQRSVEHRMAVAGTPASSDD